METLRRDLKLDILLIEETKVKPKNTSMVHKKVWKGVDLVAQSSRGLLGGLMCLWDPNKMEGREIVKFDRFYTIMLKALDIKK